MKELHKDYLVKATPSLVWKALTDPEMIELWGAGPDIHMSETVGSRFSLWGGDIYGKNISIAKEKELVQEWFSSDWIQTTPSIVTFTLTKNDHGTNIHLDHTGIPDDQFESIDSGWDEYYLGAIQNYLEEN